jgi:predicted AAA+ superfamily ATPase
VICRVIIAKMINRFIQTHLKNQLEIFPAVALLGARQVGKTTLALNVTAEFSKPTLYLDLERHSDVAKISDPEYFLLQHLDKLVILDEVQRIPSILPALRSLIDQRKRSGDRFGQYLLLGLSSKVLLQKTSDSLAGRICYLDIGGLNVLEIGSSNLNQLWVRGGFPDSYLASSDKQSFTWRENIIRTYLERELPILGYNISAATMGRFLGMLAHTQGELFNATRIAASLGVSTPTVLRYLDILVDLFLVRVLRPWHHNQGKRLIKTPKVYIRDSGLLHCLLHIKNLGEVLMHPVAGGSWEGFVLENIMSIIGNRSQLWFYRTSAGAEMDVVIEHGSKRIGIEIKRSLTPSLTKGGHHSQEDLNLDLTYIVYPGNDTYFINDKTCVTSIIDLIKELNFQLS